MTRTSTPDATRQVDLDDAEATAALGAHLAATRPARAVVHLQGDLGAGKSTLARALLRALGVVGTIRSPTYTLIERYPLADGEAAHLDLYRLGDAGELDFLGLDELQEAATLWLVEWPERGGAALPRPDLSIGLVIHGSGRRAVLAAQSAAGLAWLDGLDGVRAGQGPVSPRAT
jgi:tRNA threonylcarbamoyladenosine biosynthesis protein TsaE